MYCIRTLQSENYRISAGVSWQKFSNVRGFLSVITGDSERELKVEMKENEVRRRMEEKEAMGGRNDDEILARLSVPRPSRPPRHGWSN